MKIKRTSLIAGFLAGVLFLTSFTATAEQVSQPISVYYAPIHFVFDGKELSPPEGQSGFIYEGSTYVPLRFISYALNKGVEWDGDTYTVSVQAPTTQQKVEIQDYRLNREVWNPSVGSDPVVVPDPTQIEVYFEKVQYVFDGEFKQPSEDLPGLIYENSLYVPMRFFSESVGKDIDWDPDTYTVSAATGANPVKPTDPVTPKPTPTPSPTPTPKPTIPITGGGGGASGGISKPSQASLQSSAEASFTALQDEAQSYYMDLYFVYLSADSDTRKSLKSQGASKMLEFNSRFEAIVEDLKAKLEVNGYNTDSLAYYRQQYEERKAAAQAFID